MKYSITAIEDYEKLLPVARQLYEITSNISWQLLLPLFLISIAVGYTSDLGIGGAILVRLKRLVLVVILMVTFPMIAEFSQILGVEVAKTIDDMTGIDMVLNAASKQAEHFSFDLETLLKLGSDLLIGALVLCTFIILILARYLLLAFQHFYWFLLVSLGPFFILGSLFEASSGITKGLFKSMFQISCWPIIWSVLSAFLKVLPFASAYEGNGSLTTIITLNLIIAIALLSSPFMVSQFANGVDLSMGDSLRRGVIKTVMTTNPKTFLATKAFRATNSGLKTKGGS